MRRCSRHSSEARLTSTSPHKRRVEGGHATTAGGWGRALVAGQRILEGSVGFGLPHAGRGVRHSPVGVVAQVEHRGPQDLSIRRLTGRNEVPRLDGHTLDDDLRPVGDELRGCDVVVCEWEGRTLGEHGHQLGGGGGGSSDSLF